MNVARRPFVVFALATVWLGAGVLTLAACERKSSSSEDQVAVGRVATAGPATTLPRETDCNWSRFNPVRESHLAQRALVRSVKAAYPPDAVAQGVQGWVMVRILVNREGKVEKACAVSGPETLMPAAEAAARKWQFKPHFGLGESPRNAYRIEVIPFRFVLPGADQSGNPSAREP
jgi:TonB family protein